MAGFTELIGTAIANADNRAELIASRARLVAASDEVRRRFERDLHDGVQQRLVSLALELHGAEAIAPREDKELVAELAHVRQGLAGALDDLRELSRGIHPAVLSEGGLRPAVRTLARRSAVPVELNLSVDERLADHVEVGAYYVISEALTNAAKHAQASKVEVTAHVHDRHAAAEDRRRRHRRSGFRAGVRDDRADGPRRGAPRHDRDREPAGQGHLGARRAPVVRE